MDKTFSQGSDWMDFIADKSILVMKLDTLLKNPGSSHPNLPQNYYEQRERQMRKEHLMISPQRALEKHKKY